LVQHPKGYTLTCRASADWSPTFTERKIHYRDNPDIVKKVTDGELDYKIWGNNVFSIALPIPSHRRDTPKVCIELYYTDKEIMRNDGKNRIFLNNEFSKQSARHLLENYSCVREAASIVRRDYLSIRAMC
jgi:hypothetical protein